MRFRDIPQMTRDANYQVNQPWDSLEDWLERERCEVKLDINPDFQRAHVWDEEKQRRYVEFCLRGGKGSNVLRFNCVGWMDDFRGPFVLVDGKQRLEAVRKFLRSDLRVFFNIHPNGSGYLYEDFEDHMRITHHDFVMMINNLETRRDVLRWYLDINDGGVIHTDDEIRKVQKMLEAEG